MKKLIFVFLFLFYTLAVSAASLTIETQNGSLNLKVEIADNHEKRMRGLMFRDSIPSDYGMVFLFPQKKILYMWMKNTKIPLDMLFFDETGSILKIIENAVPYDLKLLSSVKPVIGVIEVQGGFSQKNRVKIGNKIHLFRDNTE